MVRFCLQHCGCVLTLGVGENQYEASGALVLGIGNILLSDDGAGVRLVEQLRSQLGADSATFIDGGTIGFALLSYVEATDSMLVVDAADLDSAPGTTALFEG